MYVINVALCQQTRYVFGSCVKKRSEIGAKYWFQICLFSELRVRLQIVRVRHLTA